MPDLSTIVSTQALGLIAGVAPLTIALVQVLKAANLFASRFAGLFSIAFGIGIAFIFSVLPPLMTLGVGLIAGLTAAGAFSAVKAASQPPEEFPHDSY